MRKPKGVNPFLGISIADNVDRVKLHNRPKTERILDHFKMRLCNPVSASLPAGFDLSCEIDDERENLTPYRQLIVALMHLANT